MALVESFRSMFKVPELKRRLTFTALILLIYRLGSHVPTPGIDGGALSLYFETLAKQGGQTLFGLYDLFVGGNFSNATIFALGIMPYISASIILQLLGAIVPYFQKLQKEGEEGRRKINQITRFGTVGLALIQSLGISIFLSNLNQQAQQVSSAIPPIVPNPGLGFTLLTMLTLTAGTVFVIKRSLSPGFAGIKNELFENQNTMMVYGDAKKVLQELVSELKELLRAA